MDQVYDIFTIKSLQQNSTKKSVSDSTSELIDDVFVKQKTAHSTPSKSDTKSYRDKINERFSNIKEKAGRSTRKASLNKDSALRIRLEKIRKENRYIDIELETFHKKNNREKIAETTEFFCTNENYILDKSTDNLTESKGSDLEFCKPESMTETIRKSENELLFKPRAEIVDISDKIETEEPRNLEEEGFYVDKNPKIPETHKNLLEQRLIKDDKKWFDCEGKMKIIETPKLNKSFRPTLKSHSNEFIFIPPTITEIAPLEELVVMTENILNIKILTVTFTHHPFFSIEHVLAQKLQNLYSIYEKTVSNNNLIRLEARVESLRQVLKSAEKSHSEEKIESYRENILQLQEKLFEENKKHRDTIKSILQTWKYLKQIREKNNYSNTNLKLIIRKEKVEYENDKKTFENRFERILENYITESSSDDEKLRKQIRERFEKSFRAPGEPILFLKLCYDHEISKNIDDPKETIRRSTIASTKIALKILYNKIEVCKTKWMNLQPDFSVIFDENISMQLNQVPKTISIEILEQTRSLLKNTRGQAIISVPNISKKLSREINEIFEKNEIIHCNKHSGVGSGIKIEEFGGFDLKTSGFVNCRLSWEKTSKISDNSQNFIVNNDRIIDKYGKIHLNKLSEWIDQTKPDPQDPKNAILYEYTLNNENSDEYLSLSSDQKYFRLNPYMDSLVFVDKSVLEENLRLKLLQLRNANEPEFDGVLIPNRLKEMPIHLLENYKRRIAIENDNFLEETINDESDEEIENKKLKGKQILKQIHIKVFQKCKNTQHNLNFEDVVDEKFLPYFEKIIRGLAENFINWFKWQPLKIPLLPKIRLQDDKTIIPTGTKQTKLIINIISAVNIPTRLGSAEIVKPFIEIDYNSNILRTLTTNTGKNPNWNETLFLELDPIHVDYLNPNSMNGTIILRVFDETDTVLTKFANIKKSVWLGTVEIPISAIGNDGLRGMFKIIKPTILFNYQELDFDKSKKSPNSQLIEESFLNLHISLEPNVPKLSPSIEELPCSDLPYLREHVLHWNENYNANFPSRKFSAFVIDSSGSTNCITRYIRPMEPPQINLQGFDVTPEQCARFVSLIPFTDCSQFYQNICLSLNEFLKLGIGSVLDHAIALTCYLLSLKVDAWLLLGFGLPNGSTAYVLVKEKELGSNGLASYYIFDMVTGSKIYLTDVLCSLQKIYCVINEHNVWANIQRNDNIATMRMDFGRRTDWWPLFDNKIIAPTNSVHTVINYTPKSDVNELEIILDRKLRKTITKLRQFDRTIWNHNVSNAIKTALNSFENTEMYNKSNSEAMEKIRECINTHDINGYIVNLPFYGINSILKKVKNFGIHFDEDQFTEFATAVYVKSYPNSVLSVWIFIGTVKVK